MAPRLEKLLPQGPRTQDKLPPGAQLLWLLALDHAGSLVEFFDRFGPEAHLQLVGKVGFEGMQIAQQVHPPALMPSWCVMVAAIKVADEYALEVLAQQVLSHLARSAVVILEVAQPVAGTQAPDIAVASILPPARLIGMDSLAGLHLGVQALHRCGADLAHAPQQADQFAHAHMQPIQAQEQRLNGPQGQAPHRAQVGDEAGYANTQAPLAQHLPRQVQPRFLPAPTVRTPALEMLAHLDRGRQGNVEYQAPSRQTHTAQTTLTDGAAGDGVGNDLGRQVALPHAVELWRPLFAGVLRPHRHVRFGKGRRRRLLVFQLGNPLLGSGQRRSQFGILRLQTLEIGAQVGKFFFQAHDTSLSATVKFEQLRGKVGLGRATPSNLDSAPHRAA
jgi:hypothetical protein